jgi:hypothetical protein
VIMLDLGKLLDYIIFSSYFILHNSQIRILATHRYKSSWRCSKKRDLMPEFSQTRVMQL